jgi:hypothetical protein
MERSEHVAHLAKSDRDGYRWVPDAKARMPRSKDGMPHP